ncbi:hypothetical protein [Rhodoferax sp.]|nr:hypothetical protein [Rhodoferax sp.]
MEIYKDACGHAPLLVNCEGYWELPLDELPAELKKLVQDHFFLFP